MGSVVRGMRRGRMGSCGGGDVLERQEKQGQRLKNGEIREVVKLKKSALWAFLVVLCVSVNAFSKINRRGGGVKKILPGTSITVSPGSGVGVVTINASGGLPLPSGDTTYLQLYSSQTITGAPLIKASSITVIGTIQSTGSFSLGGGTLTGAVVWPDGSIQSAAPVVGGGGNNQAVNTSTETFLICKAGGAVFLATSPYVSFPGCTFTTGNSTIEVVAVIAWTMTVSTALDANTRFNLKVATTVNTGFLPGNWYHRAATATVISSSNTAIDNI